MFPFWWWQVTSIGKLEESLQKIIQTDKQPILQILSMIGDNNRVQIDAILNAEGGTVSCVLVCGL